MKTDMDYQNGSFTTCAGGPAHKCQSPAFSQSTSERQLLTIMREVNAAIYMLQCPREVDHTLSTNQSHQRK